MFKKILFTTALILTFSLNSSAKTKLTFWQFWTDPNIKPVIEQIVADFEKQNPDIEIELTDLTWGYGHQKIAIAFASGRGPDIVELGSDWIAEFAANDQLMDITSEIQSDSAAYQGWGMANYHNRIYAQPWFLGTRVLFGNRDLIIQSGQSDKFIPLTLDQLKNSAKQINTLGKNIYGFGSNTPEKHRLYKKYLPFFWSFGGQLFDDRYGYCLLASNYGIKSLTYYKELHDSCGFVGSQRQIEDAFLDGKIGYIISGDWLLKRIEKEKRDINLISSFIPGLKMNGTSFLGGEFLAINNASDNKEAAFKFIKFFTSPENQIKFCIENRSANPSSVEAQKDPYFESNPHIQTFIKQIKFTKHPPVIPEWVNVEEIIEDAVKRVLFDGEPTATTLFEARKKIEEIRK